MEKESKVKITRKRVLVGILVALLLLSLFFLGNYIYNTAAGPRGNAGEENAGPGTQKKAELMNSLR